jgi:hypothetical protein
MLARKGAGCAWLRSRRVKTAALLTAAARASACRWQVGTKEQAPQIEPRNWQTAFTLANSSTIKDRKAFCGFDRLWRIEQKTAQE